MKLSKAVHTRGGPVQYRVQEKSEGNAAVLTLRIDYEQAPVPDHYYVADYFQVIAQDLDVLLVFGKLDSPKTEQLRNKIEIFFPAYIFVQQLWKSSRDFQKSLEEYVEKNKARAVGPSKVSAYTEKVQTLHANNVLMVLSAGQTIADFFYISAKDLWLKPAKGGDIGLEALVRVIMPASVLLGFLIECDKVAEMLIGKLDLKIEEGKDATLESE